MPINKLVGQTANASIPVELNAEGGNIPIVVANIVWSIDNTTAGTLTSNPDGSASVLGIAAGVVNITVKDTVFNLTFTDSITFSTDVTPVSISFVLS